MITFRERKAQLLAGSIYVAIPIEYARHADIKKGSRILFTLTEKGDLLLRSKPPSRGGEAA